MGARENSEEAGWRKPSRRSDTHAVMRKPAALAPSDVSR